jgi:hypothetical protein
MAFRQNRLQFSGEAMRVGVLYLIWLPCRSQGAIEQAWMQALPGVEEICKF